MSLPSIESLRPARITPAKVALVKIQGVVRTMFAAAAAWNNHRKLNELAGLDDKMLADIGLTRADVGMAASEPLWRDPTARLMVLAVERRASEKAHLRWRALRRREVDTAPRRLPRETCAE